MNSHESLLGNQIREQHRTRYLDQLLFVTFVNPHEKHSYQGKDSQGNLIWTELTLQEKQRLRAYGMWARRNNYIEYGGDPQDAKAIYDSGKETVMEEGKVVSLRIRL